MLLERNNLVAQADQAMQARDTRAAASLLEEHLSQQPADHDQWLKLAAVRRSFGDHIGALDASGAALRAQPDSFMALLVGGSLFEALGRREETARAYAMALARLPAEAGLSGPVRAQIGRARTFVAADQAWRDSLGATVAAELADASPAERSRIERFRDGLSHAPGGDDDALAYPDLPTVGFYDPADFAGVHALAAATSTILAEFTELLRVRAPALASHAVRGAADADAPWQTLSQSRHWSVLNLYSNGVLNEANAQLCPETVRLYDQVRPPRIAGRSPNLMFSLLDAHSRIPPHKGVTNTRLVLHIPLIVPDRCAIRVGDETRAWQLGEALVFDDTIEHEAWNDSDALRVVLLCDLWRPELTAREQAAVATLIGQPAAPASR